MTATADAKKIRAHLKSFRIETGSWAYGDSGTRFKVFHQKGAARNLREKLADAAQVHRLTGATPTVAVHVLWDLVEMSAKEAKRCAESLGLRIGAVNPTLFERDEYKFGSIANPDRRVRAQAVRHMLDSIRIMGEVGSRFLSVWAADGTNHPGQDDFRARKRRVADSLKRACRALGPNMRMLLEYKFFEPAFYSTDIADWGQAFLFCKACGERAQVLVDLGHHPQGTNIEQIVAFLIDEGMLGGFHFNCRKYADDDLTAGSLNPYELFLIFHELVSAARGRGIYDVPYMIDQSHNVEPKIEAMIHTVMNLQEAYAKALLVDRAALRRAQKRQDVLEAERILRRAFATDVTPLLAEARRGMGLPADPFSAYRRSGYQQRIERERG